MRANPGKQFPSSNTGENLAQLRQIYHSLILAHWYKEKIKASVLSQAYVDQNKVAGVNIPDPKEAQKIWAQYVEAFQKGAYNYIKEEVDQTTGEIIPRKYFSGGVNLAQGQASTTYTPKLSIGILSALEVFVLAISLLVTKTTAEPNQNAGALGKNPVEAPNLNELPHDLAEFKIFYKDALAVVTESPEYKEFLKYMEIALKGEELTAEMFAESDINPADFLAAIMGQGFEEFDIWALGNEEEAAKVVNGLLTNEKFREWLSLSGKLSEEQKLSLDGAELAEFLGLLKLVYPGMLPSLPTINQNRLDAAFAMIKFLLIAQKEFKKGNTEITKVMLYLVDELIKDGDNLRNFQKYFRDVIDVLLGTICVIPRLGVMGPHRGPVSEVAYDIVFGYLLGEAVREKSALLKRPLTIDEKAAEAVNLLRQMLKNGGNEKHVSRLILMAENIFDNTRIPLTPKDLNITPRDHRSLVEDNDVTKFKTAWRKAQQIDKLGLWESYLKDGALDDYDKLLFAIEFFLEEKEDTELLQRVLFKVGFHYFQLINLEEDAFANVNWRHVMAIHEFFTFSKHATGNIIGLNLWPNGKVNREILWQLLTQEEGVKNFMFFSRDLGFFGPDFFPACLEMLKDDNSKFVLDLFLRYYSEIYVPNKFGGRMNFADPVVYLKQVADGKHPPYNEPRHKKFAQEAANRIKELPPHNPNKSPDGAM